MEVTIRKKYKIVSADYSQQEPRLLTAITQDPKLVDAYTNNKDMYATLGTGVYNNDYWDNMEHYEDGTPNEEGAKRRKKMKTLYLGITYGMGPNLLAKKLGCSKDEAQKFIDDFYKGFPVVKKWMDDLIENAKRTGYTEDYWGRRRRLPDILLPDYTIESTKSVNFNPLLFTKSETLKVDQQLQQKITENLNNCKKQKDREALTKQYEQKYDLKIRNNGAFKSRAERQCVNAVILGSAASMTKKALVLIHNDSEMQRLGFKLIIPVHDELLGVCPEENAQEAVERLSYLMKHAAEDVPIPFKCDGEAVYKWYADLYQISLRNEYKQLIEGNAKKGIQAMPEAAAFKKLCEIHIENTPEILKWYLESDNI